MDPPPTITVHSDTLPQVSNAKIRLMCSYGGHIVPRPHDKSLFYAGGETRIVAFDRRTAAASLSAFKSHLSRTLLDNRPFALKYQLPHEDLDSLISVAADEDLINMIDEHDRIVSSPTPSRIRLFLFPIKAESIGSALLDQKATETWFCDALKGTKIMQRGQSDESGLVSGLMDLDLGHSDSSLEAKNGLELGCSVSESMVLETSSSFGSTSSSNSKSNLPPIAVYNEDGGFYMQERKVKVPSSGSMESDNTAATAFSHPHIGYYQEPLRGITVSSDTVVPEIIVTDPSCGIKFPQPIQASGYHQFTPQLDQRPIPQEVQYGQAGTQYISQFAPAPSPIPPYYPPMYHPPLTQPQQHQGHYQPNPPNPVYILPVRQTHPNIIPMQCHTVPELPGKVYTTIPAAIAPVNIPSNPKPQQFAGPPEFHHPLQSVAVTSTEIDNYDTDFDESIVYNQIYKTQPPAPPALPLQCKTKAKGTTALLSEASKLLHTEKMKHQIGTSRPQ